MWLVETWYNGNEKGCEWGLNSGMFHYNSQRNKKESVEAKMWLNKIKTRNLTKALNAGRWAAISYIQQPDWQMKHYKMASLKFSWTQCYQRRENDHWHTKRPNIWLKSIRNISKKFRTHVIGSSNYLCKNKKTKVGFQKTGTRISCTIKWTKSVLLSEKYCYATWNALHHSLLQDHMLVRLSLNNLKQII